MVKIIYEIFQILDIYTRKIVKKLKCGRFLKIFACGRETTFLFKMRESPAKCRRLDRSVNSVTNFIPMVFFHIPPENIKKPECFQKV